MQIKDIENLGLAELQQQRKELVDAAKSSKIDELAARYVQARTDATMRDEKLAAQGEVITEQIKATKQLVLDLKKITAQHDKICSIAVEIKDNLNKANLETKEARKDHNEALMSFKEQRTACQAAEKKLDKANTDLESERAVIAAMQETINDLRGQIRKLNLAAKKK